MATKKLNSGRASRLASSTKPEKEELASKIDALIIKASRGGGVASDARTALRALSDDDVTPRLVAAFTNADERVRGAAVELSTETPRRRELAPLPEILKCLDDAQPKVRLSTLVALNRGWGLNHSAVYAPQAAIIRPALEPRLKDSEPRIAAQAAVIWKRLGLS